MQELEITYLKTSELVPYANNAKKHPDKQIEQICASIRSFGFSDTVGIWRNDDGDPEIVYGHGSVLAASRMGIELVPCVELAHLSDEQRRAFCHVHNQLTMSTGFEESVLTEEIDNLDADWASFGFECFEYDPDAMFSEEEREEKRAEPKTCPNCGYELK